MNLYKGFNSFVCCRVEEEDEEKKGLLSKVLKVSETTPSSTVDSEVIFFNGFMKVTKNLR